MTDHILQKAVKLYNGGWLFFRENGWWLRNPDRFSLRITTAIQARFGLGDACLAPFHDYALARRGRMHGPVRKPGPLVLVAELEYHGMVAMRGGE